MSEAYRAILLKIAPNPKPPNRPMSTPEDVMWKRRELESIERDARVLKVDIDLERAGR